MIHIIQTISLSPVLAWAAAVGITVCLTIALGGK